MVDQGLLEEPVFTFWLGDTNAGEGSPGGEAVFGAIDKSHYTGDINYVPIRRKGYWEVELESVSFGDETMELESTGSLQTLCAIRFRSPTFFYAGAAIDTGTSLIALPTDVAESAC